MSEFSGKGSEMAVILPALVGLIAFKTFSDSAALVKNLANWSPEEAAP